MPFLRTLELASLALFGTCSLMAQSALLSPDALQTVGALAIVAFMIAQNERQRKELTRINDAHARALRGLVDALKDRPCVHDEKRLTQPYNPE